MVVGFAQFGRFAQESNLSMASPNSHTTLKPLLLNHHQQTQNSLVCDEAEDACLLCLAEQPALLNL